MDKQELKLKTARLFLAASIVSASAFLAAGYMLPPVRNGNQASPQTVLSGEAGLNTVRIQGGTGEETAIRIAQIAFPGYGRGNAPGAVILVPDGDWRLAVLATQLMKAVDGPVLYIKRSRLPRETLDEIRRLKPGGITGDGMIKAVILGNVSTQIPRQLAEAGFKNRVLRAGSAGEMAKTVDDYKSSIGLGYCRSIMAVPEEGPPGYGLLAGAWCAYSGDTIVFVSKNGISDTVRSIFSRRALRPYIYLLGPEDAISRHTASEISKFAHTRRMPGRDPYSMSAAFARFRDYGGDAGWIIGKSAREFGWGVSGAGHGFIVANPAGWQGVASACIFQRKGIPGPVLFVEKDIIPPAVEEYFASVRPAAVSLQERIYNHAWIVGGAGGFSQGVRNRLEELLEVK
ncbi:MAG: hypothetical protein ACM3WV_05795 [Bacillota bacterium]